MQLQIGSFLFPANSADVTTRTQIVRSDSGRPMRYLGTMDVTAVLLAADQYGCTAVEQAVRVALSVPYTFISLRHDNGAASASTLTSQGGFGVCVVDGPHFDKSAGPEYVTTRTVRFTAEAEYVFRGAENYPVAWHDSISIQGTGGPSRRWRIPLRGRPIRQETTQFTIVRATHAGSGIGHLGYPSVPPPAFGYKYLVNESASVTRGTPEPRGPTGRVNWPVSWSYAFEADVPLVGLPTMPRF